MLLKHPSNLVLFSNDKIESNNWKNAIWFQMIFGLAAKNSPINTLEMSFVNKIMNDELIEIIENAIETDRAYLWHFLWLICTSRIDIMAD